MPANLLKLPTGKAASKQDWKAFLFCLVAFGLRLILRYWPSSTNKRALWNGWMQRWILWRHLSVGRTATRFGFSLDCTLPDTIQSHIFFFGMWEPAISAYFRSVLRPGDICIDVGANIGYYTLLASKLVGPKGRVFAIEPSPSIFSALEQNLQLNGASNVTALNAAATDCDKVTTVYLASPDNIGKTTIISSEAILRGNIPEADVPGRPLWQLLPMNVLKNVRLLKIDVEGAEWSVIQGIAPILAEFSRRTEILVEINFNAVSNAGGSVAQLLTLFRDHGFEASEIRNTYAVEAYFEPGLSGPTPLSDASFQQTDILFRRPA